jgi:DNA-binding MarR family transcriptional regulator
MKEIKLTEKQTQVIKTIYKMQRNLRRAPTQRQVAEKLGLARTTVNEHVNNLFRKGALIGYGETNQVMIYKIKAGI